RVACEPRIARLAWAAFGKTGPEERCAAATTHKGAHDLAVPVLIEVLKRDRRGEFLTEHDGAQIVAGFRVSRRGARDPAIDERRVPCGNVHGNNHEVADIDDGDFWRCS